MDRTENKVNQCNQRQQIVLDEIKKDFQGVKQEEIQQKEVKNKPNIMKITVQHKGKDASRFVKIRKIGNTKRLSYKELYDIKQKKQEIKKEGVKIAFPCYYGTFKSIVTYKKPNSDIENKEEIEYEFSMTKNLKEKGYEEYTTFIKRIEDAEIDKLNKEIIKNLKILYEKFSFVHGDVNQGNVFVKKSNGSYIIKFIDTDRFHSIEEKTKSNIIELLNKNRLDHQEIKVINENLQKIRDSLNNLKNPENKEENTDKQQIQNLKKDLKSLEDEVQLLSKSNKDLKKQTENEDEKIFVDIIPTTPEKTITEEDIIELLNKVNLVKMQEANPKENSKNHILGEYQKNIKKIQCSLDKFLVKQTQYIKQ